MWVLEPGEEPDLALESLGTGRIADVRTKDLDGNGCHAAAAELALDQVPVIEQLLKPLGQNAHGRLRLRRWQYALLDSKRKGREAGSGKRETGKRRKPSGCSSRLEGAA
jgi:hypothetical protein